MSTIYVNKSDYVSWKATNLEQDFALTFKGHCFQSPIDIMITVSQFEDTIHSAWFPFVNINITTVLNSNSWYKILKWYKRFNSVNMNDVLIYNI